MATPGVPSNVRINPTFTRSKRALVEWDASTNVPTAYLVEASVAPYTTWSPVGVVSASSLALLCTALQANSLTKLRVAGRNADGTSAYAESPEFRTLNGSILRPITTISTVGWNFFGAGNIHQAIGEEFPNDTAMISAAGAASATLGLTAVNTRPNPSVPQTLRVIAHDNDNTGRFLTVQILQGTAPIASRVFELGAEPREYEFNLSDAEKNAVTNWATLRAVVVA
jgi:hypothetical protein